MRRLREFWEDVLEWFCEVGMEPDQLVAWRSWNPPRRWRFKKRGKR